ncbi:complement regulatory protein [Trypanosoma cruzi]|nr:complement regulatory protein [Trypanosoma cruzi]
MCAVGCDCCGGPHPFGLRFSAVVPCVGACHLLCAWVLGMFFQSVVRLPSVYGGLCEWARADEGQGVWNEGMACGKGNLIWRVFGPYSFGCGGHMHDGCVSA